jgi:uncharacterized protein (TIGR02284 family)
MNTSDDRAREALDQLLEACKDGEHAFRSAARRANDRRLRARCQGWAGQLARFAAELRAARRRWGGGPLRRGTILGTLQRGLDDLRAMLLGRTDADLIARLESGEEAVLQAYEAAAQEPLPPEVHDLVERQLARLRQTHDEVAALEQTPTARR